MPAFRKLSDRQSQQLLEEYHEWLTSHEIDPAENDALQPVQVAVGIYYSEQSPDEEEPL